MKEYEFSGVIKYAHCFSFEIKAKNKKEAKEKAEEKVLMLQDPASAEYQDYILDEAVEIID